MQRFRFMVMLIAVVTLCAAPGFAVDRADRDAAQENQIRVRNRLYDVLTPVKIANAPADKALSWWSASTGVPLVVDWRALENAGVARDTMINLDLQMVPAGQVLSLIMQQMTPDDTVRLMYELTPWYVQLTTQQAANRRTVTRIYDIADLLLVIPDFEGAPDLSLRASLSNTSSGSGAPATASGSLFPPSQSGDNEDASKSRSERGEEIAQLIRDTIEPEIWRANGGEFASVRYFNGRLIVTAPAYVHAQIGTPTGNFVMTPRTPSSQNAIASPDIARPAVDDHEVASVQKHDPTPVARKRE